MQQEVPVEERTEAVKARIADFCTWFDVEPPKLRVRKGAIYLTDELMQWFKATGASIDWIICGCAKSMAGAARNKWLEEQPFRDLLQKMSDEEIARFATFTDELKNGRSFDEALADMKAWIADNRVQKH